MPDSCVVGVKVHETVRTHIWLRSLCCTVPEKLHHLCAMGAPRTAAGIAHRSTFPAVRSPDAITVLLQRRWHGKRTIDDVSSSAAPKESCIIDGGRHYRPAKAQVAWEMHSSKFPSQKRGRRVAL